MLKSVIYKTDTDFRNHIYINKFFLCFNFLQIQSSSSSSSRTSPVQTSVIQSTKTYHNGSQNNSNSQIIEEEEEDTNFSGNHDNKNSILR